MQALTDAIAKQNQLLLEIKLNGALYLAASVKTSLLLAKFKQERLENANFPHLP
jgi:hypothetical protein